MKRIFSGIVVILVLFLFTVTANAGVVKLSYKMKPGQVWQTTMSSQSETMFMGNKNVNRTRTTIEYRVADGPKKGWVSLTARITSQKNMSGDVGGQMDLSKIKFTAEMHTSGEIRNIQYSGNAMPPMDTQGLPPEMAAMMARSANMVAEAWKDAVFWFPELPEDGLEPGDEFEMVRKIDSGGAQMGMQSQTVMKQIFTLEDVSSGLAYFSVRDRSVSKTKGIAGGKTKTKTAGKGESVFDIKAGMWTDLTVKSKSRINMSNMPGMGNMTQEALQINKFVMEQR
jgi:hypothetical protein